MNTLMPGGPNDPQPMVHYPNLPVPYCFMTPEQLAAMHMINQPQPSMPPPPPPAAPEPSLPFLNEPEIQPDLDSVSNPEVDASLTRKRAQPASNGDEADDEALATSVKRWSKKKKVKGGEEEKVLSMPQGGLSRPQKDIRKELQVR